MMLSFFTSKILGNIPVVAFAAAGVALLAYFGWLQWSIVSLEKTNLSLVVEKANLTADLSLAQAQIAFHETAQRAMEESIKTSVRQALEEQGLVSEIENAPDSHDGDVAPALRNALDRLPE